MAAVKCGVTALSVLMYSIFNDELQKCFEYDTSTPSIFKTLFTCCKINKWEADSSALITINRKNA